MVHPIDRMRTCLDQADEVEIKASSFREAAFNIQPNVLEQKMTSSTAFKRTQKQIICFFIATRANNSKDT